MKNQKKSKQISHQKEKTIDQEKQRESSMPDSSSLHQGQGPDFQTQAEEIKKKNPGIEQLEKDADQKNQLKKSTGESEPERPRTKSIENE